MEIYRCMCCTDGCSREITTVIGSKTFCDQCGLKYYKRGEHEMFMVLHPIAQLCSFAYASGQCTFDFATRHIPTDIFVPLDKVQQRLNEFFEKNKFQIGGLTRKFEQPLTSKDAPQPLGCGDFGSPPTFHRVRK